MFENFLLFFFGMFLGNVYEYFLHRHILHGLGKRKKSYFSSHWHKHHRIARRNNFYDFSYKNIFSINSNAKKELINIGILAVLNFPLYFLSPAIYFGLIFHAGLYFVIHRYSHLNPVWAKKYLPWHWEHHLGKDQDKNWCVTFPLTDQIILYIEKIYYTIKNKMKD